MGQYFKPVPVPAGASVSCGHIRTAFTSAFSDVKIYPRLLVITPEVFPVRCFQRRLSARCLQSREG